MLVATTLHFGNEPFVPPIQRFKRPLPSQHFRMRAVSGLVSGENNPDRM